MLTVVNHAPISPDRRLKTLIENENGPLNCATLDAHRVHPRTLIDWLATECRLLVV